MVLEHPPKGKKMDDNWGFAHGLENLHISNLHHIHTHIYIYIYILRQLLIFLILVAHVCLIDMDCLASMG